MDLLKPFKLKDIAKNHQIYIENSHKIFDLQKKKDKKVITEEEKAELLEREAWNESFKHYLKKNGL